MYCYWYCYVRSRFDVFDRHRAESEHLDSITVATLLLVLMLVLLRTAIGIVVSGGAFDIVFDLTPRGRRAP